MRKKKNILRLVGVVIAMGFVLASCGKDTEAADPYADWEARNALFLDSIANVAANPPSGEEWVKKLNFKLSNATSLDGLNSYANTDYVYMKILPYAEENIPSEGIEPLFTDSVDVHYRGTLINGTVFDESYSDEWDARYSVPVRFAVSAVITGWTTALQTLKEGQRAEVYIPYTLAYQTSGSGEIPGYSLLIFDLRLEKVIHPIGPDDRSRTKKTEVPEDDMK